MKTPSDELFQLIKSLDTAEKRFFKIYASKNADETGSTNYVKLFDAIDGQEKYNEAEIKTKLRKESFIRNLKKSKNYLYHAIITSLEHCHSADSVDAQLQHLLLQTEILFEKKLFASVKKILLKAEKLAIEHERYPYLLSVLTWKRDLVRAEMNMEENLMGQLVDSFSEDFKYVESYKNQLEYRKLFLQTSVPFLGIHPISRSNLPHPEIKKMLKHPLLASEKKAISLSAKKSYYYSLLSIYRILGDFEKNYLYTKQWIECLEREANDLNTHAYDYMQAMVRLLVYQNILKKYDEHFLWYNKLNNFFQALPPKLKTKKAITLILKSHSVRLYHLRDSGKFSEAVKLINTIEEEEVEYEKLMDRDTLLSFYFISTAVFLISGQFKSALHWVNKLVNTNEKKVRPDLMEDAKMLSIIIHYELGNIDYLPYLVKSTFQALKKNSSVFKIDFAIVNFFQKHILTLDGASDLTNAYVQLKKEIEIILKQPNEVKALSSFDYLEWVESKIRKCYISQIIKENNYKINN